MLLRAFVCTVSAIIAFALAAASPSRAAGGCDPNASQPTCDVLDDCGVVGALDMTAPPQDAVVFYRSCLFTDHRYTLVAGAAGSVVKPRSQPLPKIYASTFWPLYCQALERAGQRDASICDRRASAGSTRRTHRRSASRRHRRISPQFTG